MSVKVSTRSDYAARALLSLALHGSDRPTSVKEIAERTNLPQPYLEQILLAVKGAGLVRSKRGVGGGYVLARLPEEITLADIYEALGSPNFFAFGHRHADPACLVEQSVNAALGSVYLEAESLLMKRLEAVTLAGLYTDFRHRMEAVKNCRQESEHEI